MRFLFNKRLHVNMGPYEHVELTASVEVDTEKDADLLEAHDASPDSPEQVISFLQYYADEMLFADVEEAHYLTAEPDSFIHEHHKNQSKEHKK